MVGGVADNETINGRSCKVFHFKYKGQNEVALKMWHAEDLNYTIKRDADAKTLKGTFEILNIKTGQLNDALFEIPAGYVEVKVK